MPTVTQSLEIPASPDRVWALATDFSRYGEWNVTHSGFPEGPPQPVPGATFTERITMMGIPGEAQWTVTETTPPKRTVWSGSGPMGVQLGTRLELAPSADGTIVTIEVSFDGGPLVGPIGDAVAQSAHQGAIESLQRLSRLVA